MKKAMMYLLVLALLLVAPFSVDAKLSLKIDEAKTSNNEDGETVRKEYTVSVVTTENETVDDVEVSFSYGDAITSFSCGDAEEFVASETDAEGNSVVCKFESPEGVSGDKIVVGTVVLDAKKNAPDEDCVINYAFKGATGKINPNTGSEVPYAYIVGGLVLAAGVYFVTKKKSALHRI